MNNDFTLNFEYRIYFDTTGNITSCSMQNHSDELNYIVVTKQEYDEYYRYTVVNNKLKRIEYAINGIQIAKGGNKFEVALNHASLLVTAQSRINGTTEFYSVKQ